MWFTSGEPYGGDANATYSPTEAASIAGDYPWARLDSQGDLIVGMYRERASWPGDPMEGWRLALQLTQGQVES